jgi:hypothetical protein
MKSFIGLFKPTPKKQGRNESIKKIIEAGKKTI